jgi:hypothetical protein
MSGRDDVDKPLILDTVFDSGTLHVLRADVQVLASRAGFPDHRAEDMVLARPCRAVTAEPPDEACAAVMRALVGNEPTRDDIALLMFRRRADLPVTRIARQEADRDA